MLLDQFERHLDIPPASVDLGHRCNRERTRLSNVGDVASQRIALPESHEPNGVFGPVSTVGSQPHDAVEHLAPLIEDVYHLIAGLCPQPAQPAVPLSVSQSKPKYPKSATTSVPAGRSSTNSRANTFSF